MIKESYPIHQSVSKFGKIKTDAVVVEGKHNKIKLNKSIGGIKYEK